MLIPGVDYLPASGKIIGDCEKAMMYQAVEDGWLTAGRFNERFEKAIATFHGGFHNHVMTTNSGSSANLLAISALTSPLLGDRAIKPGDEVITVACGFPTTVNPIIQIGAIPVFVDIDIDTLNAGVGQVLDAITPKTKAIVLAHTLGNPFPDEIATIAKDNGLFLVEDCCDALGATIRGQKVGTLGDIATFSFYPAHHITTGEGGAVMTRNKTLKRSIESIRDWGRGCWCPPGCDNTCGNRYGWKTPGMPENYDHKYIYTHLGYNLKMTDIQAACGLAQMDAVEMFIASRRRNAKIYRRLLNKYIPVCMDLEESSWFGMPILCPHGTRTDLARFLESKKIGSRNLFGGNLTKQPYFKDINYRIHGELKNTDRVAEDLLWVGTWPGLDEGCINYISISIKEFYGD